MWMGQVRNPHQILQSSMRCLALLRRGNCHLFANTPLNRPCRMEMVQAISLFPLFRINWGTSITSQKQLGTQRFPNPRQLDHPHASPRFLGMDHHLNHQTMLFVESYPPQAEDTSILMQIAIEDYPRMMANIIQALAIIVVVTRRLQVRISQGLLLRRWLSTG
jgi:hypothetical protein